MIKEEVIEPVLKEILDDIKKLTLEVETARRTSREAIEIAKTFEKKLLEVKVSPPTVELAPFNEKIDNGVSKIKMAVEAQPKIVKKDYHFHLFPKINIKEYYATYSKLLLYAAILLLAAALANVGSEWIKGYNQRQDNLEQIEALKRYEENEYQLEVKRSRSKTSIFSQSPVLQKERSANDKIVRSKKKELDSVKTDLEKRILMITRDTLHK